MPPGSSRYTGVPAMGSAGPVQAVRRVSLQFACGLRPVEAERIQFGELVQKTRLRRHRNDAPAVGQQDRLTKLPVPVSQREFLALVRGDAEIGALHILH